MGSNATSATFGIEAAIGRASGPLGLGDAGARGASPHAGIGRASGASERARLLGIVAFSIGYIVDRSSCRKVSQRSQALRLSYPEL